MSVDQDITLNVPIDLTEAEWAKIGEVYKSMDGWTEVVPGPAWYGKEGDPQWIWASAEPSGLQFCGNLESAHWISWITVLCARLTLALGREVHDACA